MNARQDATSGYLREEVLLITFQRSGVTNRIDHLLEDLIFRFLLLGEAEEFLFGRKKMSMEILGSI